MKLSTSEDGRATIWTCIKKSGDNFLYGLIEIEKDEIKYHSRSGYSSYKLKAESAVRENEPKNTSDIANVSETLLKTTRVNTNAARPKGSSPIRDIVGLSFSFPKWKAMCFMWTMEI